VLVLAVSAKEQAAAPYSALYLQLVVALAQGVELTQVDRAGLVVVVPAQAIRMATKVFSGKAIGAAILLQILRQAAAAVQGLLVSVVMTP
jgi:hypothetical protein